MINFESQNDFKLYNPKAYMQWIENVVVSEEFNLEELQFIFCNDDYLLKINQQFLNHDTYTDIITFDQSVGKNILAEIYISTERVAENAKTYKVSFDNELKRVIIHGVLHCMRFGDKTEEEQLKMREKENEKIQMFHVEQN
ncbi:rRNA maturation RNase YbeY [Psychroflexus sp. ALD_RP9]|uniref:rRNA maturation RNase YbeY n=1 Tax=Psychroflexus sp. ALD_RP9 TaxID=2777186 RepID=UPI001A8E884B|nr:rRNA maturation RNase YbeY [Psychroflexus sp. ALD_RP9]QSS98131.1 rRNA maturation RNase YbeY [Psychroflexus sp. ALD_RP9]